MASSGHRANIMNSAWSHGGVGAYGKDGAMWGGTVRNIRMYTELFIKLKSAPPPPPPSTPAPTPKPPAPAPKPPPATPKPVVATPKPVVATPQPTPIVTPRQVPVETASPTPEATPDQQLARDLATKLAALRSGGWDSSPASHAIVARSMRVESAGRYSWPRC